MPIVYRNDPADHHGTLLAVVVVFIPACHAYLTKSLDMFRAGTAGEFAFIREETSSTWKGTSDSIGDAGPSLLDIFWLIRPSTAINETGSGIFPLVFFN